MGRLGALQEAFQIGGRHRSGERQRPADAQESEAPDRRSPPSRSGQQVDRSAAGALPALAEDPDPLGRAPGEPLWPEVYTHEHLLRVKSSRTNYYWRAMYQQDPLAEGSTEWPESFFGPSIWFDEWPEKWWCRAMALDPSKERDARFGDYSAFVMLQFMIDGVCYVDADLLVRNVSVISETALELCRSFQPDGFAIETNQFQELLASEISRLAIERRCPMPIYTIDNHVPKIVRIRRLTSLLAQGRIKFKAGSPGARLLVEQLRDFPNGDHDDGPDALEMAVRIGGQLISDNGDRGFEVEYARC